MKKNIIYFLSCLVLTVGLVSCSDDDKEPLSPLTVVIEGAEAQEVVQGTTLNLKAVVEGSSEVKYAWTLKFLPPLLMSLLRRILEKVKFN